MDDDDVLRDVRLQDPKVLASHYTWKKRLVETISVLVFTALLALMILRAAHAMNLRADWAMLLAAFFSSVIAADFVSGLVHWFADTWGTVDWPIVGPSLIKNFREHHSAPSALAQKGLVETNGDNCMILVPVQLLSLLIPIAGARVEVRFAYAFVLGFTFWIMMTNQIHKWAHMRVEDLPLWVRAIQRTRIVLSREEHVIHHTVPFESHYCITTGWLNRPLARIGFFRWMERAIWKMSGAVPRENDIGTDAAVALAIRQGVLPQGYRATRAIEGTRSTPTA